MSLRNPPKIDTHENNSLEAMSIQKESLERSPAPLLEDKLLPPEENRVLIYSKYEDSDAYMARKLPVKANTNIKNSSP